MSGTEWIAPTIAGIVGVVTTAIVVISAARNRKKGALEQRAPDVTEAWAAAERARDRMFIFQDLFFAVRGAFKGYARRMLAVHGDAAALNDDERQALELQPPPEPKSKE